MASLKDQLLKAGLTSAKRVRQVEHQKRVEARQAPDKAETARQRQQEQAERSRQLNAERQEQAARRARQAEVRQLVEQHRVDRDRGETAYQFVHGKRITRMYVKPEQVDLLARGRLAIAWLDERYHLVTADTAEKIRARCDDTIVSWHQPGPAAADDPYKDFPIPDDLDW